MPWCSRSLPSEKLLRVNIDGVRGILDNYDSLTRHILPSSQGLGASEGVLMLSLL